MLFDSVVFDKKKKQFTIEFKNAVREIYERGGSSTASAELALAWACHMLSGKKLLITELKRSRYVVVDSQLISVELEDEEATTVHYDVARKLFYWLSWADVSKRLGSRFPDGANQYPMVAQK